MAMFLFFSTITSFAQNVPITMEPGGNGATWTWTVFENGPTPPPIAIGPNPSLTAPNTSAKVLKMEALQVGNPWAGFECAHGDIGSFTLNASNAIVKVMVYKPIISDVGVKFVIPSNGALVEIKKPNTVINQWEELSFDFTSRIGDPNTVNMDQIVIFPDYQARTTNNVCYIDNISFHANNGGSTNINVKFAVQATDSTPVYVFGNWNNWSNYPGVAMPFNNSTGNYEATIPLASSNTIEYLYVNGIGTKEVLNPANACTNGNALYTNRKVTLGTKDTSFCNIWKTCIGCAPLNIASVNANDITVNLNQNFIDIVSNTFQKIDKLEIFDLTGRRIFEAKEKLFTNNKIPVSLLPNTIYLIKIKSGNSTYQTKSLFTF